jgi:hypothetical protein
LLKNLVLYCLAVFCESFCSSAAEKRDYAAFRLIRQLIFFFSALDLFRFRALQKQEANYSKPKHGHAREVSICRPLGRMPWLGLYLLLAAEPARFNADEAPASIRCAP